MGEGVYELRILYGPGYRIYFTKQGETIVVLLRAATCRPRSATSSGPRNSPEAYEEIHRA